MVKWRHHQAAPTKSTQTDRKEAKPKEAKQHPTQDPSLFIHITFSPHTHFKIDEARNYKNQS
jgi:hypothetical protein